MVGCRLAGAWDEGVLGRCVTEVTGMTEVLLAVGTRKGLFIGRRRGGSWEFDDRPHFNAQAVYAVAVDTRGAAPRLLAAGDSAHWGPSVFHS
ncbi:exo-alpha-sialidase, partial [Streptomyces sp. SID625]|nr:exo-alpha-sialidase [Streptomyces sp. SID625]